jgi:hypothetical protein
VGSKQRPDAGQIADAVIRVLERIADEYECATLRYPGREPFHPGWSLECSVPGAASVFVVPEDRWIEIQAGSSIFEVWYGKHQLTEVLDSFQLFLAAIIEGRFEETQWTRRGRWIKSIGVLHLATGEVRRSHHANLFPVLLPGFRKREHLVYAPYQ